MDRDISEFVGHIGAARLAGRYLRQGLFLDLIRAGYIGATAETTAYFKELVDAVVKGDRAVVEALSEENGMMPMQVVRSLDGCPIPSVISKSRRSIRHAQGLFLTQKRSALTSAFAVSRSFRMMATNATALSD